MDLGTDSLYGIGAEELVAITGAHLSTARRWKRLRRLPRWLQRVVSLCIFGDLGQILTIRHDSTSRESFMPGVVVAINEVTKRSGLVYGLDRLMGLA